MSQQVLLGFDPYVAWLGIRDENRPLNPYQLLGIPLLESNQSKINAAATRQRRNLDGFRTGANPDAWEQVRDEIEAAVKKLTNSDAKAVLDASIIRKQALQRGRQSSGERAPAGPTICCKKCSKENPSQRRFCGDCGTVLWGQCGSCGAEVPVDEKFCGICGANLLASASAELEQAKQTLDEIKALREKMEYDGAIYAARKLAKTHDPRLNDVAEEALAMIDDMQEEIVSREQAAADALERARTLISGYAYEGAIAELHDVPPRFVTEEIKQVLNDALGRRNEILVLSGEIREAIEQKRTGELLPKIERLLALKPNHEQAQKIAEQLRDRMLITAKKRLIEHKYPEAIELLHQIPSFVRTADVDKLLDQAEEFQWLAESLRLSPVADQTLQELADRYIKLAPTNENATKTSQKIVEKRAQPLPADPRQRYAPWGFVPKTTLLNWPVDWLTGCQNFKVDNAAHAALLQEHPGRFFIAMGLALQGLDKAPLDLNLIPDEKKGFSLKQFSSMLRKRGAKAAWGIDVNASSLKAIKLVREDKEGGIAIAEAVFIKHRKLLSQPDAELERGLIMAETLKDFLGKYKLDDARVVVNMPAHKMLGRFFDLPAVELKKVPDAVEYETRHQLPIALDELYWDWSLVAARELAEHEETRRVVVIAGRDYHVNDRLAALREAGLKPDILTLDCIALHHFVLHEFFGLDPKQKTVAADSHDAVVTLDVGAECSNLVISSPSVHWFRTFNIGGDQFTEPLVKQFRLTYGQAELLKREPFRARRMSQLYATFDPLFASLGAEINRSLDTFQKLFPDQTLSRIYGVGGGFALHGLWRYLRHGK